MNDVHGPSDHLVEGTLGEQVRFVKGQAVGSAGEVAQELKIFSRRKKEGEEVV